MIESYWGHGPRPKSASTLYLLNYLFSLDFLLFKIQIKSNKWQKLQKIDFDLIFFVGIKSNQPSMTK